MVQRLVRPVVIGGTRAPPAPTTQLGAAPPRTTLGTGLARTALTQELRILQLRTPCNHNVARWVTGTRPGRARSNLAAAAFSRKEVGGGALIHTAFSFSSCVPVAVHLRTPLCFGHLFGGSLALPSAAALCQLWSCDAPCVLFREPLWCRVWRTAVENRLVPLCTLYHRHYSNDDTPQQSTKV